MRPLLWGTRTLLLFQIQQESFEETQNSPGSYVLPLHRWGAPRGQAWHPELRVHWCLAIRQRRHVHPARPQEPQLSQKRKPLGLVDASRAGRPAGQCWKSLELAGRHRVGAEWPGQVEGQAALARLPSPAPGPACEVELKHSGSFLSFVGSDVAHFLDVQEPGFKQWCCQEARKGLLPCAWSCPSLPTS